MVVVGATVVIDIAAAYVLFLAMDDNAGVAIAVMVAPASSAALADGPLNVVIAVGC